MLALKYIWSGTIWLSTPQSLQIAIHSSGYNGSQGSRRLVSQTTCKLLKTLFDLSPVILEQVHDFEKEQRSTPQLSSITIRQQSVSGNAVGFQTRICYMVADRIVTYGGFRDPILEISFNDLEQGLRALHYIVGSATLPKCIAIMLELLRINNHIQ